MRVLLVLLVVGMGMVLVGVVRGVVMMVVRIGARERGRDGRGHGVRHASISGAGGWGHRGPMPAVVPVVGVGVGVAREGREGVW